MDLPEIGGKMTVLWPEKWLLDKLASLFGK